VRITDEPTFACLTCFDESSGWAEGWCPGKGPGFKGWNPGERDKRAAVIVCDRAFDHLPHQQVYRCPCWGTNRVVMARRERSTQRKAEQQPQRRGAA
jgi:hypothetical protein